MGNLISDEELQRMSQRVAVLNQAASRIDQDLTMRDVTAMLLEFSQDVLRIAYVINSLDQRTAQDPDRFL